MLPLLHTGHSVTWSAWQLEPTVIVGALIVGGAYVYALASRPADEHIDGSPGAKEVRS